MVTFLPFAPVFIVRDVAGSRTDVSGRLFPMSPGRPYYLSSQRFF